MSFNVETFTTLLVFKENRVITTSGTLQFSDNYFYGESQIKRIALIHLVDEEIIPLSEATEEITCEKPSMPGDEILQLKWLEMEEREKKWKPSSK